VFKVDAVQGCCGAAEGANSESEKGAKMFVVFTKAEDTERLKRRSMGSKGSRK
jgi:hypothetical protein